jgi:hypothetical protein
MANPAVCRSSCLQRCRAWDSYMICRELNRAMYEAHSAFTAVCTRIVHCKR